jgi:hypothetical protein
MSPFVLIGIILFSLGGVLVLLVIIFSTLKYFKREYFPSWKFLDYFSVGYIDYLYKRYILRDQKKHKKA